MLFSIVAFVAIVSIQEILDAFEDYFAWRRGCLWRVKYKAVRWVVFY